jgi:hypothetical protein
MIFEHSTLASAAHTANLTPTSTSIKPGQRLLKLSDMSALQEYLATSSVAEEYRSGPPPKTYSEVDALTCDDIIPGLRLALAALFRS